MKKIAFFISAIVLLLPFSVLGAVSYTRSPAGYTIQNPVSFSISLDSMSDTGCAYWADGWTITAIGMPPDYTDNFAEWISPETLNHTFVMDLPIGDYWRVQFYCGDYGNVIEWLDGFETPTFVITEAEIPPEAPAQGKLFTLPTDFASGTLAMAEETIRGLKTAQYILAGIALATGIILFIMELYEDRQSKEKK